MPLFGNFHFIDKKRLLIMNITVFLLNRFLFMLNFSFFNVHVLFLKPGVWALKIIESLTFTCKSMIRIPSFYKKYKCTHIIHMKNFSIVWYRNKKLLKCKLIFFMYINTALSVLKIVSYSKNKMLRLLKPQVWAPIIGISLIIYIFNVCKHYFL